MMMMMMMMKFTFRFWPSRVTVHTLCSKKSDAKIQITITMAHLIELIILLASSIIAFLAQMLQISTKSAT